MYKVLLRLPDKELQCRISWLFFTKNGRLWNCEICVHFVSPKLIQLKRVMLFLFAHINTHTHVHIYIHTHTYTDKMQNTHMYENMPTFFHGYWGTSKQLFEN